MAPTEGGAPVSNEPPPVSNEPAKADDKADSKVDGAVDKAKEWLFGSGDDDDDDFEDDGKAPGSPKDFNAAGGAPASPSGAPASPKDYKAAGGAPASPSGAGAASPSGAAGATTSPSQKETASPTTGGGGQRANNAPANLDSNYYDGDEGDDDMAGYGNDDDGRGGGGSPKKAASDPGKSPKKHGGSGAMGDFCASMGDLHHPKAAYLNHLSTHKEAPQITMHGKVASGGFMRSNSNPGPGNYNSAGAREGQSKFKAAPQFSFGGSTRFGLGINPAKERPGPGHYGSPKDPGLEREPRMGFGTGMRQSIAGNDRAVPGPGAYESRTSLGQGRMTTAAGRHVGSAVRIRMSPGPGSYSPTDRMDSKFGSQPKVGFGTGTRNNFAEKRASPMVGPGTYDMHLQKVMGTGSGKYSMRSRRTITDLASFIEPGPGHYGSHATQFKEKDSFAKTF